MFLTDSEIVHEIVKFGMVGLFDDAPRPDVDKLKNLTLQQMLDAARAIERKQDGRTSGEFQVVPDDRLTAAVYTWLHYCAPGYHDDGDKDDAIVHLKVDGTIHGLVKYARKI